MFEEAIKNFFGETEECPDCGWFFACDKCSKRYDAVDEDIDRVEQIKNKTPRK